MGRQANISDMFACRLLMYTPMGWIPTDSIDSTTEGYSYSPTARVLPPSPWSVAPLGGGTPTGPLASPPSPPISRCRTRAPTEPPPYKLCDLSFNFFSRTSRWYLFGCWCPLTHLWVSCDTGKNILGYKWSCLGHCGIHSQGLSSL